MILTFYASPELPNCALQLRKFSKRFTAVHFWYCCKFVVSSTAQSYVGFFFLSEPSPFLLLASKMKKCYLFENTVLKWQSVKWKQE